MRAPINTYLKTQGYKCKYCGSEPVMQFNEFLGGWWSIRCSNRNCHVAVFTDDSDTEEGAIEAWNTRKREENG